MNKLIVLLSLTLMLVSTGCRTVSKASHVVSPEAISNATAEDSAPALPHMKPWWEE